MSRIAVGTLVTVSEPGYGDWTGRVDSHDELGGLQPAVICTDPGKNPFRLPGMKVICTAGQIEAVLP